LQNSSRLFEGTVSQRDVIQSLVDWVHSLELDNTMILEFKENELPPALVVISEPVRQEKTVMVYGFLDKQPETKSQWSEGKSAYEPVQEGNRLYGRGASEGAGSLIAAVLMVKAF
jgi:acetylornithine deacetylase/succinyl-diaminopimelate desuccinylase-like protein